MDAASHRSDHQQQHRGTCVVFLQLSNSLQLWFSFSLMMCCLSLFSSLSNLETHVHTRACVYTHTHIFTRLLHLLHYQLFSHLSLSLSIYLSFDHSVCVEAYLFRPTHLIPVCLPPMCACLFGSVVIWCFGVCM
jgi:hypothetical protein